MPPASCGRDVHAARPERNEIMFGSETFWPFEVRESIKDAQIGVHGGSLCFVSHTHKLLTIGIEQFIGSEKLKLFRSWWFAAHSGKQQPRDEKQSLLILCADRTLKLFDWLIVPPALGHSPVQDVRELKKRPEQSFDWLIDVWDFNLDLFFAYCCVRCSLKFGFHLL